MCMTNINQNQLEAVQLEKEAVLLGIEIIQKNYKTYFDIAPSLKFFDGLTLSNQEKSECKEVLISLSECIQEYIQHCFTYSNKMLM